MSPDEGTPTLSGYTVPADPPDATHPNGQLSADQKADADKAFAALEKEADLAKWGFMMARVPQPYHDYFLEKYPNPSAPPATPPATP